MVEKATGWRLFRKTVWGRAYPRIIGLSREPSWLFFEVVIPAIGLLAYLFIYKFLGGGSTDRTQTDILGLVILGGAAVTYWLNILWMMASQLYWDKQEGLLELFILSPTSLMAILLGMSIGGLVMATIRASAVMIFGIIVFSIQFSLAGILPALAAFLITMFALYGLGMMLSTVFLLWGRAAWQVSLALTEPIYALSGMYSPLNALKNPVLVAAAGIVPISLGLDAIRQLLLPSLFDGSPFSGVLNPWLEVGILFAAGVVFNIAAYILVKRVEWLAKVKASLSLRWQ